MASRFRAAHVGAGRLARGILFARRYGLTAARSLVQLIAMRIVLDRRGYAAAERLARRIAQHAPASRHSAAELARVVHRMANVFPQRLNCLPRSLTLWTWVSASAVGHRVEIRIGAAPRADNVTNGSGTNGNCVVGLDAHAWVEIDGQVLGEHSPIDSYVTLPIAFAPSSSALGNSYAY